MNKEIEDIQSQIAMIEDLIAMAEEVDDPFCKFQLPIRLTALKERLEKLKDE